MNRIDRQRMDVLGNITATFYPRQFNSWNSRVGTMFLRKHRGLRKRGRAMMECKRAYMRAHP